MSSHGVACVIVLALAIAVGCGGEESAGVARGRVLLVGIDGASLRIARPLMNEGRLPQLTAMARAGHFGPLRSHFPLHSPRIWTSIATGKLPRNHGIEGFAYDDGGVKRLYLSTDRRSHALWNIASDEGLRVGVVNWWNTYPLEVVDGVIVSDHLLSLDFEGRREMTGAAPVARGPIAYPESWHARVAELMAREEPLSEIPDPFAGGAAFPDWIDPARLSKRYRGDEAVVRIALEIERELSPDLMLVFLPGIDRISHFLWAAVEPESAYPEDPPPMTAEQRRAMVNALEGYYEFTDRLIARLSESYGPDDLVMVVSDHGFEAGRPLAELTGTHESRKALNGVIFASGARVGKAGSARPISVNDITPTILAWLGMPPARDMDGVAASFLQSPAPGPPIASYDRGEIARVAAGDSGAEAEILEQLQALGYMESDPAEDASAGVP